MLRSILFLIVVTCAQAEPILIWSRPDGGVSFTSFGWSMIKDSGYTEERLIREETARIQAANPDWVLVTIGDSSAMPDRSFRNACTWKNGAIAYDRKKSEDLQRAEIQRRIEKKREMWVQRYTTAQAEGDADSAATAQQKLRRLRSAEATDLTTPSTLNDLKNCVPSVLAEPDP